MLLIDDLLLAPAKGLLFVCRELAKNAEEALEDDEPVRQELQQLYMRLETGAIGEREFEEREQRLAKRLEAIEQRRRRNHED